VLPTFLQRGESKVLSLHSFTPEQPGMYEVDAAMDGRPWATWRVQVGAGDPAPKPAQAAGGLAGRLYPAKVVADVFAGERVDIDVVAENTGQTLWDGQVRLAYRWSRVEGGDGGGHSDPQTASTAIPATSPFAGAGGASASDMTAAAGTSGTSVTASTPAVNTGESHPSSVLADLPALTGRIFLGQDTPPGWSYRFADRIVTPAEPGTYRLTVSMLAEGIIWFDEMTPPGIEPLVYDVTVRAGEDSPPCVPSPY
jgi:hypothetical protein